ncbi:uncharacterized protein LOC129219687 isoform X2 [Uloborus diversus]|uniref:uncharacterized protein LOC129219687 isoform X2 n=1 Tax=Uloborus diversus TaxID=327109 RepID=UPI002409394A|nr:uncharacterized protein LOC129219687 isoform X2 [Uloborus diversus]
MPRPVAVGTEWAAVPTGRPASAFSESESASDTDPRKRDTRRSFRKYPPVPSTRRTPSRRVASPRECVRTKFTAAPKTRNVALQSMDLCHAATNEYVTQKLRERNHDA